MSRRKKDDQQEPIETDSALEALDAEQEEAAELDAVEAEEKAPAPKLASARKPAKKAARTPFLSMAKQPNKPAAEASSEDSPAEQTNEALETDDTSAEEEADEPSSGRGRGSRLDVAMKKNVALASTTAKKSVESMEKQWQSIQEISQGVSANLERIQGLMKEIPAAFSGSMQELLKPPATKNGPVAKIAMGASVIAIVFSLLSLSLAQTARQTAISNQVAALTPDPRVAPVAPMERPRLNPLPPNRGAAPEIAARSESKSRAYSFNPFRNQKKRSNQENK